MLADFNIDKEEILYRGGKFSVRGLSFKDIQLLISNGNRDDLDKAVEQLQAVTPEKIENADNGAIVGAVANIVQMLPELTGKIIALAADEPDEWEKAVKLPMPVQLDAVLAIGRLTFDGEDSVKNFIRGLMTLVTETSKSLPTIAQAARSTGSSN